MFAVNSLITRTDVTCVKFDNNNILAGIGGKIFIFDKKLATTKIIEVLQRQQIFGIIPNILHSEYLIFGENQLRILDADDDYKETSSFSCDNWILSAKWINLSNNVATVSMHNNVSLWTKKLQLIQTVMCTERCILYSASLVNDTWQDLIVLSGTVFSQILLWCPQDKSSVLARLDGHKGVIFSVDYNQSTGIICSTSDDRSARLWSANSKSLLEELKTDQPEILLKCALFCHTARVFRCLVLDDCVLTAGEDSLVVVWNLNGEMKRKMEVHQGASIWSLDYDKADNVVVTGGGDCGITLFSLQQVICHQELTVSDKQVLKRTALLSDGSIVCISESGTLLLYDNDEESWVGVNTHQDLINYSLLEVSKCRSLLALAGYQGSIHLYKLDKCLTHFCSYITTSKSRIFSLHWLSSNQFLTCELEGVLLLWLIDNGALILKDQFILPMSKERWTTSACFCTDACIAVGDRKGNIYVFNYNKTEPIQIIKKAHNYLGVTSLYFKENILLSLGRNSVVKTYQFNNSFFSILSLDKLPFSWLTSIYEDGSNEFLLAFLGDEFVVWDYKKRRTLIQCQCGGGHRSWDFHKIDNQVKFIFIKEKCVHLTQFNSNVLDFRDVLDGFHSSEINSVFCFPTLNNTRTVVISGGEDTTLRLSTIDYGDEFKLTTKNVFKSHLSSVRTITGCQIKSGEEYLVFSAGGRAQIIVWELNVSSRDGEVVPTLCEKFSHYEQLTSEESETRIMDLCAIVIDFCVVLIAATSSGVLKIFLISSENGSYKMELAGEVVYKLKCILKLKHLLVHHRHIVLSTATDGNVIFWDLTEMVSLKEGVKNVNINKTISVHGSGINSIDYRIVNDNQCVLLTGGDDNTIKVTLISLDISDGKLKIDVLSTFTDSETHCAQITGVFLDDNYYVTTSIDQKLNISSWVVKYNNLICKSKQIFSSNIADIQGMLSWKRNYVLYVLVYGKGIELFQIKKECNL